MNKLVKLVRVSSKEAFIKLRALWEIKCNSLENTLQLQTYF